MQTLNLALIVTLINVLAGCATKDTMLPVPDRSMKDVYDAQMSGASNGKIYDKRSVLRRPMIEGDINLSRYVRSEKNYLESKFRTIPNPTMYMFVAPHLASQSQVPIPGYLTEFRMWDKEHYAMPGEISDLSPSFGEGNE